MNNPGDYIPPRRDVKQPPSCWLIGGVGCLVIFILAVLAIGVGTYNVLNSKTGKQAMQAMGNVIQNTEKLQPARQKMANIRGALVRYELKNGDYPKTLAELYPRYLANQSDLHSDVDANSDPKHVSFTYFRPTPTSPPATIVLEVKSEFTLNMPGHPIDESEVFTESLNGTATLTQYQDGRQITQQSYPE